MESEFKRSFDSLEKLFDFTEGFFERERIGREHRFAVNLAVEELFTNMVKYNPASPAAIEVRMDRDDDQIEVVLTDRDAEPFDVTAVEGASVDKPLEERQPGKLGLFLVKKVMDRVKYEYQDRQSRITLIKKLG
jgi:anti-sigma regulatory factor (Ser/Thr protein kinase)